MFFCKTFRIIPRLSKRVLHIVWALCYIHIVVEVTMNMAEYILVVVNFEPIKRRLKNDNFDWDAGVKSVSY